ncbi:MAG TPA: Coq4 family protein, partial [Kofleriaceae bacterium]|nr:Coq4 family protein [Kofleriaceae bacterium]
MTTKLTTVIDATRKALLNPQDTEQAFRIADALSFGAPKRITRRYRRSPIGRSRLADRRQLLDVLLDRAALEAMPAASVGRAYLDFLDSEGITAGGLVAASEAAHGANSDPDVAFVQQELRDMHDLWHTVTGYRGDLLGEAGVLAFSFGQLGHIGLGFLAAIAIVLAPSPYYRRFVIEGFRKGRAA